MPNATTAPEAVIGDFAAGPPQVRLVKAFATPFRNAVATAKTCYSSKGIIDDDQIGGNFGELAKSIYQAGHHTTLQHAHFQFAISNVSRQCLWNFLHSHPFYNSEQVSQRYVEVKPGNTLVPALTGKAMEVYEGTVDQQYTAYRCLCEDMFPLVQHSFSERFPHRKHNTGEFIRDIRKKVQEIARYVLPIATYAYLYHTVSGVTLLRYYRLARQEDCPKEQFALVTAMVKEVLRVDPDYRVILEEPLTEEEMAALRPGLPSTTPTQALQWREDFDQEIGGRTSVLVDWKARGQEAVAAAVREVLGLPRERLSDTEALEWVLNPAKNRLLGETLNLTTHDKLSRALYHASYTFRKKISHTADSQDQRHRMTPASRPSLLAHFPEEPDYIIPQIIREDNTVETLYRQSMDRTWEAIAKLRRLGVSKEDAAYLFPNALAIRFTESADLLNLHHKCTMRLCYNAQEEIWRATLEEAEEVSRVHPLIGKYLLPPCTQRFLSGNIPVCPEGKRFCGVRVWKLGLEEYERRI